jgi:hypothetical protein
MRADVVVLEKKRGQLMKEWIIPGAAIVSAASSLLSAVIYYKTLETSLASVAIAAHAYERNVDARFELRYTFPGDQEYVVVRNSGTVPADAIVVSGTRYFVSDKELFTVKNMMELLRDDVGKLSKLKDEGIVRSWCDFRNVMGAQREFAVESLGIHEQTELEVSHFVNENAVRVAETLGLEYVVLWRVKYLVGPDEHAASQIFGIWMTKDNTRIDLADVAGGVGVVARILKFEDNTTDVLFPTSSGPQAPSLCPAS